MDAKTIGQEFTGGKDSLKVSPHKAFITFKWENVAFTFVMRVWE